MKAHIGIAELGLVHSVIGTPANVNDMTQAAGLLHGQETEVFADAGCRGIAKVEHPFRAIKQQFGYAKVRYRGLAKNTAHLTILFALSNLWMARRQILAEQG